MSNCIGNDAQKIQILDVSHKQLTDTVYHKYAIKQQQTKWTILFQQSFSANMCYVTATNAFGFT